MIVPPTLMYRLQWCKVRVPYTHVRNYMCMYAHPPTRTTHTVCDALD